MLKIRYGSMKAGNFCDEFRIFEMNLSDLLTSMTMKCSWRVWHESCAGKGNEEENKICY